MESSEKANVTEERTQKTRQSWCGWWNMQTLSYPGGNKNRDGSTSVESLRGKKPSQEFVPCRNQTAGADSVHTPRRIALSTIRISIITIIILSRRLTCHSAGVGDSAALIQVLSEDILSVHWARAATHWDGAQSIERLRRFRHQAAFAFFFFLEMREPRHVWGASDRSCGCLLAEGARGGASPRRAG